MRTILVTGHAEDAAHVAASLRSRGARAVPVAHGVPLPQACAPIPPAGLAGYIQLPVDLAAAAGAGAAAAAAHDPGSTGRRDTSSVDEVRALIAGGLLTRFDALAVVAPLLAPDAVVVLVPGDRAGAADDSQVDLPDLVRVLARVILGEHGADSVRVAVAGTEWAAADLADLALRPTVGAPGSPAVYASLAPELDLSDRRSEVFSRPDND